MHFGWVFLTEIGGLVRRCNELLQHPWEGSNVYFPIPISPYIVDGRNPVWYGCFPKIGMFPPKWMVKMMENPIKHGMIWGGNPLSHLYRRVGFLGSLPRLLNLDFLKKVGWLKPNLEAPLHWRCSITGYMATRNPANSPVEGKVVYSIIDRVSKTSQVVSRISEPSTVLHDEARFPESHQWGPPLE